ncbi:MAG: CBS domain-containing protein [Thaumarchaeota archaeon]|nr:CBS domain-containing protein [Nitrososphaerota archaeon]
MREKINVIDSLYLYSDLSPEQIATRVGMESGEVMRIIDGLVRKDAIKAIIEKEDAPVREIMRGCVAILDASKTALDAANLMIEKGTGCVVVTSQGKPFGMVTEKDLLCESAVFDRKLGRLKLGVIASRPLVHTSPLETIGTVADMMLKHGIRRVPVMDEGLLVGLVDARDIAMMLSSASRPALGRALLDALSRPRSR